MINSSKILFEKAFDEKPETDRKQGKKVKTCHVGSGGNKQPEEFRSKDYKVFTHGMDSFVFFSDDLGALLVSA